MHPELPTVQCDQFGIQICCDWLEIKILLKQHLQNSGISFKSNLSIKEYALTMQAKITVSSQTDWLFIGVISQSRLCYLCMYISLSKGSVTTK